MGQFFDLSTWVGWVNRVVSEPANVIALSAFLVSMVSAWASWRHSRLSVLPAFSTWVDYPTEEIATCKFSLSNKGFGPGIIESFEVWHGHYLMEGQAHRPMRNLLEKLFKDHYCKIEFVSGPGKGQPCGAGEEIILAKFDVDFSIVEQGDDAFEGLIEYVSLVLRYKDIYGRRWVYVVHELEGRTYRWAWWSLGYVFAKFLKGVKL